MRTPACPSCRQNGRLFQQLSRNAWFDFYRCNCGYVWTIPRVADDDDQAEREVTPRRLERACTALR